MKRDYLASKPPATNWRKDVIEATAWHALFVSMENKRQAQSCLTDWQASNREQVNCLQLLPQALAKLYEDVFRSPDIDLTFLPSYSFVFQFAFTLAQPYISRDEQDFYIIDNPVRKDKILKLPYVASTSWKGSLRSTFWRQGDRVEDEQVCRLFGRAKKDTDEVSHNDAEHFQAGRLYFYPAFFTLKSLEIINPQDRSLRSGRLPIPFESVPQEAEGIFTLLYVPFDRIGLAEAETGKQAAEDMGRLARGLRAMFRDHGFGAKTSSGFGLANSDLKKVRGEIRTQGIQKFAQPPASFDKFVEESDELAEVVTNGGRGK